MPTSKIMFGADFLRLLPLHSAAGIGDRCTRRRIVEQDGDIFTSSFENLQCRGGIGVLRVPHMTVKVINLVSANTAKEQSWWKKKKKERELFHQNRRKNLCSSTFSPEKLSFSIYIFMWTLCQSRNVISGTILSYKGLPCLDYASCSAHKINNFTRVPCLKPFSSASCFCLLPSASVRETKFSWTPENSLFTWGEEVAFYTFPLCEQGKALLLPDHQMDQLTGNSSHFQQSICTIFCPYNEPRRLLLTSLLKSAQRLLGELHKFILDYIWLL